ncbi:MAG: hypothetical protein A3I24_03570 [Candidatus Harrisonbacteria bacterium RIFCSPLOWO2_02_FULL_41_13b]|uniref:Uncharacterized protein n=2 Tax=Parcubacteria group TaxID=1794811 RepID=A0A1G1ZUU8_9BACT|nr:MAG: hypothetical protein A3J56_02375 [Candidatus Giovannonibacteria bacterium RIFCSPHIGHO2_02_FULL_46_20]OGY68249.1 MAG: hypothetical protein A3I24_03570 [Candidatus Harrisonbacteria bacterium RIFCSPLOWO2_02_FULL_41_13b]
MKKFLQKTWSIWKNIAHGIGWVNSRIILTILFIVLFGIYHIFYALPRLWKRNKIKNFSMWIDKPYKKPTIAGTERQF